MSGINTFRFSYLVFRYIPDSNVISSRHLHVHDVMCPLTSHCREFVHFIAFRDAHMHHTHSFIDISFDSKSIVSRIGTAQLTAIKPDSSLFAIVCARAIRMCCGHRSNENINERTKIKLNGYCRY